MQHLQHSRIPSSSSEDLCPEECTQRHHQHYLALTRTSPNWRGKGAYFALFLLLKTASQGVDGEGHSLQGSLAKPGLALLCWNGSHAITCKCWGPDLTVKSCASLPCPPGPCHQTGKVCLYLFFGIPQAPSAVSASYYPPAAKSSAGASHRAAGHPCFRLCCEMGQALCSTG